MKLTSVYRDTHVYIEGHGYDKITHAYAYGGPELAINTINKNFDLNVSEFVAVNFDSVVDINYAIALKNITNFHANILCKYQWFSMNSF